MVWGRAVSGVHEGTRGEVNANSYTGAGLVNRVLMGVKKVMRLRDIFRIGTGLGAPAGAPPVMYRSGRCPAGA